MAEKERKQMIYCVAEILSQMKMIINEIYNITVSHINAKGDSILQVIKGAPLMVIQNIDISKGNNIHDCILTRDQES